MNFLQKPLCHIVLIPHNREWTLKAAGAGEFTCRRLAIHVANHREEHLLLFHQMRLQIAE